MFTNFRVDNQQCWFYKSVKIKFCLKFISILNFFFDKSEFPFKKSLLAVIRPKMSPVYKINDPLGIKLLTRLRVNFSHLREHKFRHNFLDTINPLCSCGLEIESTNHYILRCSFFYTCTQKTLLDNITAIIGPVSDLSDDKLAYYFCLAIMSIV